MRSLRGSLWVQELRGDMITWWQRSPEKRAPSDSQLCDHLVKHNASKWYSQFYFSMSQSSKFDEGVPNREKIFMPNGLLTCFGSHEKHCTRCRNRLSQPFGPQEEEEVHISKQSPMLNSGWKINLRIMDWHYAWSDIEAYPDKAFTCMDSWVHHAQLISYSIVIVAVPFAKWWIAKWWIHESQRMNSSTLHVDLYVKASFLLCIS